MPRQTKKLQKLAIGNVTDLFFDGEFRTIHCLVVETDSRQPSCKLLITRQQQAGSSDCDR